MADSSTHSFSQWMKAVDARLIEIVGLTHLDLSDWCYRDEYDGGADAADVADDVLEDNGWSPDGDYE